MALLVTVVKSGLAQVPIFPTRWLVTATTILSQNLGRVDPCSQGRALRPGVAEAAIATIFIAPTLLVVPARSFDLDGLKPMRRHGSCLLEAERKGTLILDVIVNRFQGGAVAPEAASIYLTDLQRKVQGPLGHSRDSFFNSLVLGVFLTTFLLGLGMNRGS